MNIFPDLPPEYRLDLAPNNVIIATHPTLPTFYLNEQTHEFEKLEKHVSEVNTDART